MKDQIKKITSHLVFRITAPIILIWLIFGLLPLSFLRSSASDFIWATTENDMIWLMELSGAVVIVILLVLRSGTSPIRRILHRLASAQKPDYKGTKHICLDAGINDYLAKPVDGRQLSNMLVKFIQPRSPSQQPRPAVEQTIDLETWDEMRDHIPGIDLRRSLNRIGGHAGLLRKILGSFLEQFSEADQQIRQMLTQGNMDQAKQLVHTIKGTAGNIGAEALYLATRELERRILAGPGSESAPEMDAFVENHRRVIDSLAGMDLDQAKQAALPAESDGPLDADAITALLCEVEDLLTKSDSRVRHLLPKLAALVKGKQLQTELKRLDRAIYRLDSDLALKCVSEMNATIQRPTKQDEELPHAPEG